MSKSVAVVTMSTRGIRVGPQIAAWVRGLIAKPLSEADVSVADVDLVKFNLPVFNESVVPAMVPAMAQFEFEHSRVWSAEMGRHAAYVLVVPEYNYGVAGATKNALDYLKNEVTGKPVVVLSYGVAGGNTANEQVRGFLKGMGLRVCDAHPALALGGQTDPNFLAAAMKGELTEDKKTAWKDSEAAEVVKAAAELKDLLLQPNTEENVPKPE
ncbi:NADPH-dependent FMN reductase family protein [Xylariomycetidae sp. FL2044]|nr:NADPH-dependent FMN reductase family protein [Xylariomycetidae sp. FL2044]